DVVVVRAPIGEPVDEGGVTVVGEDHLLVGGEERVELRVGEAVRVLPLVLQAHQVHHVHHAYAQVGQVLAQERGGGHGLERGNVAGAAEHHVALGAVVG